jgi:hypothetical protein
LSNGLSRLPGAQPPTWQGKAARKQIDSISQVAVGFAPRSPAAYRQQKQIKWREVLRPVFIGSILAVISLVLCATAPAQDYPSRPIRIIIPLAFFDCGSYSIKSAASSETHRASFSAGGSSFGGTTHAQGR